MIRRNDILRRALSGRRVLVVEERMCKGKAALWNGGNGRGGELDRPKARKKERKKEKQKTKSRKHMHKHNHTHKTCCCKKRHVNRRSELLPAAFPSWLGRAGTKDKPVVHLFFKSRNDTPARQISSRSRWSTSHLAVPSGDLSRLRYCLLAERWRVGGEEFEGVGGEESILLRIGECGCSLSVCLSFPRQGQPKNPTTEEKQTKSRSNAAHKEALQTRSTREKPPAACGNFSM
ncbi:hypothetical protein IWX92DRAFT_385075 [Phyllosticta citricarpa]